MLKYCGPDGSCIEWKPPRTPHIEIPDTKFSTLPDLYEKYRLSICWLYYNIRLSDEEFWELVYKAIRHHWFVCQFLEKHPNAAKRYLAREDGWMYYDILSLAEEEYAQDLH